MKTLIKQCFSLIITLFVLFFTVCSPVKAQALSDATNSCSGSASGHKGELKGTKYVCAYCGKEISLRQESEAADNSFDSFRKQSSANAEAREKQSTSLFDSIKKQATSIFGSNKKQTVSETEHFSLDPIAGDVVQVAIWEEQIAVLRSDGTVRVDGASYSVDSTVKQWKDVTKVWADSYAIFGLTKDGKVLSTKGSYSSWSNVKDLFLYRSASDSASTAPDIFAVKTDGTVMVSSASGNYTNQDFSGWKNIESIYVSEYPACVMGLTADDSLMLYQNGKSNKMLTDVKSIYQDSFGYIFVIKENGRVQGLQADTDDTIYFLDWKLQNIESVTVRLPDTLYAITTDGDLISSCASSPTENYYHDKDALDDFTNIVALGIGRYDSIIALRKNGSTIAYPKGTYGNAGSWRSVTAMKDYQGDIMAATTSDGTLLLVLWDGYLGYEIGELADFWFAADQAVICLREDGSIVKVPMPDLSSPDYATIELTHLTSDVKH